MNPYGIDVVIFVDATPRWMYGHTCLNPRPQADAMAMAAVSETIADLAMYLDHGEGDGFPFYFFDLAAYELLSPALETFRGQTIALEGRLRRYDMPNHCENRLSITGPKADLDRFWDGLNWTDPEREGQAPEPRLLDTYHPMPQGLRDVEAGSQEECWQAWYSSDMQVTRVPGRIGTVDRATLHAHLQERYKGQAKEIADRYEDNRKTHGFLHWYDWALTRWGTKWGDYDHMAPKRRPRSLLFYFFSAWSPPVEGIEYIAAQFPTLTFRLRYWEGGAAYQGRAVYRNGELEHGASWEYRGRKGG